MKPHNELLAKLRLFRRRRIMIAVQISISALMVLQLPLNCLDFYELVDITAGPRRLILAANRLALKLPEPLGALLTEIDTAWS